MIDIINFKGEKFELGFSKIIYISEFKVKKGSSEEKNRNLLNDRRLDILVLDHSIGKDKIHYRSSGLNQVSCKIAKENDVCIGFSFNEVLNSENKSLILGRMKQNVRLCRKFKVRMVLGSFAKNKFEMRNVKDLVSFGRVIGMTGGEVKKALNFEKKMKRIEVY
jgi:RNase P/RNase MRP subunit p30